MRIASLLLALLFPYAMAVAASPEQQREDIMKLEKDTLTRLYRLQPAAEAAIKNSAGYAVFRNMGVKIFVAGGGTGKGVAVDRKTNKRTYMKMGEVQAGLGVGVKKFRVVFVFEDVGALENFVNSGWEFGGQTTAAVTTGADGAAIAGAVSVSPGVWMYQLTDAGLAAEVTVKGTKYWKDDALN